MYLIQSPDRSKAAPSALWVVLHGAYADARQAAGLLEDEARAHHAVLLAPQASRPCGDGYCWQFAHDSAQIADLVDGTMAAYGLDRSRTALVGYSMGCTLGLWLLAARPDRFSLFAALAMGSAWEPWEHDDGGIPLDDLRQAGGQTSVFLSVDHDDPAGCAEYFESNVEQLQRLGFRVETFQSYRGTHTVTDEMRTALLPRLPGVTQMEGLP